MDGHKVSWRPGPATIGDNGDISQGTTRGLAVYRYADQVIAFTDGQSTWLYGPEGLQKRPIADKFAWEQAAPVAAPAPARPEPTPEERPPSPAPSPVPPTTVAVRSGLTPDLAAKCSNLGFDLMSSSPGVSGEVAVNFGRAITGMCRDTVEEYGEAGYACFEPAAREFVRRASQPSTMSGETATKAFRARVALCTDSLPR